MAEPGVNTIARHNPAIAAEAALFMHMKLISIYLPRSSSSLSSVLSVIGIATSLARSPSFYSPQCLMGTITHELSLFSFPFHLLPFFLLHLSDSTQPNIVILSGAQRSRRTPKAPCNLERLNLSSHEPNLPASIFVGETA
jgi:hypothetical protein